MLNNATPSRPRARHQSIDTDATGVRPTVMNFDSASPVRGRDLSVAKLLRKPMAA